MPNFDDFDTEIQCEEAYSDPHDDLCPHCGTDHTNPDDESRCYAEQEAEFHLDMDAIEKALYANAYDHGDFTEG